MQTSKNQQANHQGEKKVIPLKKAKFQKDNQQVNSFKKAAGQYENRHNGSDEWEKI